MPVATVISCVRFPLVVPTLMQLDKSDISVRTPTSRPGMRLAFPLADDGGRSGKQAAAVPQRHRLAAEDREQQGRGAMGCARSRLARIAGDLVRPLVVHMTFSRSLAAWRPTIPGFLL